MKFTNPCFIVFLSGCLLFFPFLGSVHLFDWDEINFAECAREMIASGNYSSITVDYVPFHEKPPLFIWMQALSMNIFGINEFAARFPNAVCGVITLLVLFRIGKKIKNTQLGIVWALAYAGSFLPHFYFRFGIIDPWFNLFVFLGIYFFILSPEEKEKKIRGRESVTYIFLSALFMSFGVLTKGPVALLIFLLCLAVYWAQNRFRKMISSVHVILYSATLFIIGGSWYIFQFITNEETIIGFINYQFRLLTTEDAGHGWPVYYHTLILLFGCFPASVLALAGFRKNNSDTFFQVHFKQWMVILFFVVLILFSIVKTKIAHYSSLCYFPLSFLAACSIENEIQNPGSGIPKIMLRIRNWLIGVIGILIGLVLMLPPVIDHYKEKIILSGIIKDEFAVENLKAVVNWSGFEVLPGIIFVIGIIIVLLMLKRKNKRALPVLVVLCLVTIHAVSILIVPKIEQYTQGSAIEFYKKMQGENCYVETLGFKSYAYLFYFRKQPQPHIDDYKLLNGIIDKPAYFVTTITHAEKHLKNHPNLKELYRKNGFIFYIRK